MPDNSERFSTLGLRLARFMRFMWVAADRAIPARFDAELSDAKALHYVRFDRDENAYVLTANGRECANGVMMAMSGRGKNQRKTHQQIVDECNALAREFYGLQGYRVRPDYKFYNATHPQEVTVWEMAVLAFDTIEGTCVQSALAEVKDGAP